MQVGRIGMDKERPRKESVFTDACGCIKAGNEADGGNWVTGPWRAYVVLDRRRAFGGVGGVAIHVGVRSDTVVASVSAGETREGDGEDTLDVGVHIGDAEMGGRGKNAHIVGFLRKIVSSATKSSGLREVGPQRQ